MTVPERSAAWVGMLASAAGARLGYSVLTSHQPGGAARWTRTNHRGEPVTLLEGPAVALAGAAAALAVPGLARANRVALAVAALGGGGFGCYDDLRGEGDQRGFRGHLGALARGKVTSGVVKLAGIGLSGVAAAAVLSREPSATGCVAGLAGGGGTGLAGGGEPRAGTEDVLAPGAARIGGQVADVALNAVLIAASANLLNLFDLRPGRAIKVAMLASGVLAAAGPQAGAATAVPAGAAAALLPEDLGERAMLGDAGANALGAMLGVAAASAPRKARMAALGVIVGLTAASEKVSFTKVIDRTPPLRWLDMLGRRRLPSSAGPPDGRPMSPDTSGRRRRCG